MRYWYLFICLILVGLLAVSCSVKAPFPTYTFAQLEIRKPESRMGYWLYEDISGDGIDEMIYSTTGLPGIHHLIINDSSLKPISQINSQHQLRGFKVLKHPEEDVPWLFYTYNDSKRVFLNAALYEWVEPLKRSDFSFEPIARNDPYMDNPTLEWFGMIDPVEIIDLDQDGKYELVCRTLDSYTANPRGIVVYDLETRAIKWNLDLTTNPCSVICADFDGDGKIEILLSTQALKNTRESRHGVDDGNGWMLMLDAGGKILQIEHLFEGYGNTYLAAKDIDSDGRPEIYKVESTWGNTVHQNTVEKLHWQDGTFRSLAVYEAMSPLNRGQPLFFNEVNADEIRLFVPSRDHGMHILNADLQEIEHEFEQSIAAVHAISDLLGKGSKQVILQSEDSDFYVLDHDGRILATMANPYPDENRAWAHVFTKAGARGKYIGIVSPMQLRYYELKRLPLHLTIYAYIHHYRKTVNVIILVLLAFLFVCLYRLRSFYINALNNSQSGYIVMQNKRRIVFVNQFVRYLAKDLDGDVPLNRLDLLFPELYKHLLAFSKGFDTPYKTRLDLPQKSGSQMFDLIILKHISLFSRYVLILNPVCEMSKELNDKLAWAELARRLSHHVRRHISNILLALDPLEKDLKPDSENREYLNLLKTEINQIKVFTHSFQRFTELKDYQLKAQDIIPSLEHVLSRISIPKDVIMEKDWGLRSIGAFIEPIRFEEALTNLITNALDAMPKGGTLQLSVREFPLHEIQNKGRSVLIEIEDSGVGIPEKYREEIWQPFFTTKQSGTGIGLPESRKIIESMQGSIEFQSEVGVGTIVSIWLKGTENG